MVLETIFQFMMLLQSLGNGQVSLSIEKDGGKRTSSNLCNNVLPSNNSARPDDTILSPPHILVLSYPILHSERGSSGEKPVPDTLHTVPPPMIAQMQNIHASPVRQARRCSIPFLSITSLLDPPGQSNPFSFTTIKLLYVTHCATVTSVV